jgi:Replication protein C (RepC)
MTPGKQKKASAETLAEYAFGATESKDTRRRQLGDVRKALPRLRQLDWTVEGDDRRGGRQVFTMTRPALPGASAKKAGGAK